MKSIHKLMKAKKRRKDYEKKRNIIRYNTKRVVKDKSDNSPRWANPKVTLPGKNKWKKSIKSTTK